MALRLGLGLGLAAGENGKVRLRELQAEVLHFNYFIMCFESQTGTEKPQGALVRRPMWVAHSYSTSEGNYSPLPVQLSSGHMITHHFFIPEHRIMKIK